MMTIGYARVSTADQNLDRQLDLLKENHCERIFCEKKSGTQKDRPELTMLLKTLRKGDTVIVCELARLSRKVKDIFDIVEQIHQLGADIKSLKENWLDTTTPTGKLMFTFIAGISQFERDIIRERTLEGMQAARARGRMGGRPFLPKDKVKMALKMYDSKDYTLKEIEEATGVKKTTLYLYVNRRKNEESS